MSGMNLMRLLDGLALQKVPAGFDPVITGIACDSRAVKKGDLFFALPGQKADASEFVPQAVERGAVAVVGQRSVQVEPPVACVEVGDARAAMAHAARRFYDFPDASLKMTGVTGTNGKTTTAFLVRHLISSVGGLSCGFIGTVGYDLGSRRVAALHTTPESNDLFFMLREMNGAECKACAMEVSSHALAQKRAGGIDWDAVVFTNLTQDHLDYHGTMENYFSSKRGLFESLGGQAKCPVAVINADDPWGARLIAELGGGGTRFEIVSFGSSHGVDLRWEELGWHGGGTKALFSWRGERVSVDIPLFGSYNVANCAAALGAARAILHGVPWEKLAGALAGAPAVPGRLEVVPNSAGLLVFVDYAHTDDALKKVLETIGNMPHGRIITVMGCGGNRDAAKRPKMGEVAARLSDVCYLTSDNPRSEEPGVILGQVLSGVRDRSAVRVVPDRREAIFQAVASAVEGDVVLIAGKGHEDYQEIAGKRMPFDDRRVASEALAQKCRGTTCVA